MVPVFNICYNFQFVTAWSWWWALPRWHNLLSYHNGYDSERSKVMLAWCKFLFWCSVHVAQICQSAQFTKCALQCPNAHAQCATDL